MQLTLTSDLITSVANSQHEILRRIVQLYCPNGFDADFTYNTGGFYSRDLPQPRMKFDLNPQAPDVIQADVRALPVDSSSIGTGIFDPPFLAGTHVNSKEYVMTKKYTGFKNMVELYAMYTGAIAEFSRVFSPGGILVFKCQNVVSGRQFYTTSQHVLNRTRDYGFECIDEFICVNRNPIITHSSQQHSRKVHTYFFVFRKRSRIRKNAGGVHG